ncbi:MAG: ribonuclease HII [Chloroflexi bacterium]|nr:MAG: ribonuclease HII [Chloroflexota bacterium]
MASLVLETSVWQEINSPLIAGLDEAGRGALAGPVVAAAVILPLTRPDQLALLNKVNDSKQLTARTREKLYQLIVAQAVAWGVGIVAAEVIDRIGILPATREAMRTAVSQLAPAPDYLLIDGRIRLRNLPTPQQAVIRGDSLSLSIAAASIIAKVTRDQIMTELDKNYPQYGFARHKGYGTAHHLATLAQHGPSPVHRFSFAPLRNTLL